MRRVPDVIDAWFDSGSMPFAQWHYPFENKERFEKQFPADFISEAVDQSRGWFYTLLAISVFARDTAPYKNVLVCGHVVDGEGKKMSKSLGNYIEPFDLLDSEGADAVRLYMTMSTPIWSPLKFEPEGPREMNSKMLGTLRNSYAFFTLYANLDDWDPSRSDTRPEFTLLDRWIRSRYETLVKSTRESIEAYELTRAAKGISHFIVEELSNWYVRRSRRRFWKGETTPDKEAAFRTLFEILEGLCRLCAPFTPFISEALYRNLHGGESDSVHLAEYPTSRDERRDEQLEESMEAVLQIVGLGRTLRNQSGVKIRQPLRSLELAGGGPRMQRVFADDELRDLVLDELNIKELGGLDDPGERMRFVVKPRFKVLGPRVGGAMKELAKALSVLEPEKVQAVYEHKVITVEAGGRSHQLNREDLDLGVEALGAYAVGLEGSLSGALSTEIDRPLAREGHLRELVNRVQNLRKGAGLEVSDRIRLRWSGGELTRETLAEHGEYLAAETLALDLTEGPTGEGSSGRFELAGEEVVLEIEKA
jgi:isoleucyl-tRNA synthetase